MYVDDDFELITFDFVTEPSTKGAYLVPIRKAYKKPLPDQVGSGSWVQGRGVGFEVYVFGPGSLRLWFGLGPGLGFGLWSVGLGRGRVFVFRACRCLISRERERESERESPC